MFDNSSKQFVDSVASHSDRDLKRFLRSRTGNHADADDLAQEVYLRLLRVEKTELVRCPQAYLFRIASNVAYEWRIRARNRLPHSNDSLEEIAEENPGADEQVWQGQMVSELANALDRLPANYRAAILLTRQQGMSYQQAGEQLGLSTETIKKYLSRGIAMCREYLAPTLRGLKK